MSGAVLFDMQKSRDALACFAAARALAGDGGHGAVADDNSQIIRGRKGGFLSRPLTTSRLRAEQEKQKISHVEEDEDDDRSERRKREKSEKLGRECTPRQRARVEHPASLEAAGVSGGEGLAHQARRRLPPIPRPSQLGKRKDEGGFEEQAKGTRPRNLPVCLCCGGLLRASVEARAEEAHPDSLLLKCAKCGLINRVAS